MLFQVDFIIALYTSYVFLFHSLDGIPLTSIAVSPLGSSIFETKSVNKTHMNQYRTEINSQANAREYLISSMIDLPITTINSIKLQASSLTQLTHATNQLTRYVLTMASNQSTKWKSTKSNPRKLENSNYRDFEISNHRLVDPLTC